MQNPARTTTTTRSGWKRQTSQTGRPDASNHAVTGAPAGQETLQRPQTVAIIGAGWVGVSSAIELCKRGYDVTLYEKNADIFCGVSGTYGLRLHEGPHYPRSATTRKSCQRGHLQFRAQYPDVVIGHAYSVYGLGDLDADGHPSKVDPATFRAVCQEAKDCREIDPYQWGYQHLVNAFTVTEPSVAVGARLRNAFWKYLKEAGVHVVCRYQVRHVDKRDDGTFCINRTHVFDHVVNATYYQDLLPFDTLPAGIEVVYQPCVTLRYTDTQSQAKPFSFTVMDGMFVCLMPREDQGAEAGQPSHREYTLYHAKYTILGSFDTAAAAQAVLDEVKHHSRGFLEAFRPLFEQDIQRFYPGFADRFAYVGMDMGIAAKFKTVSDFRTAVTFKKDGVIYVFSGKVNNIFDAAEEIARLLTTHDTQLCCEAGYYYLPEGEFARSRSEIRQKPTDRFNTANLQTFRDLWHHLNPPPRPTLIRPQHHPVEVYALR